jgi:hypothetical protein
MEESGEPGGVRVLADVARAAPAVGLPLGVQAVPPTPAQIADHHQRHRAYALVRFTDRHPVITHNAAWAIKQ